MNQQYSPQQLQQLMQILNPNIPGQPGAPPEMADDQQALLDDSAKRAHALRDQDMEHHTTALGALLGGAGTLMTNYKGLKDTEAGVAQQHLLNAARAKAQVLNARMLFGGGNEQAQSQNQDLSGQPNEGM